MYCVAMEHLEVAKCYRTKWPSENFYSPREERGYERDDGCMQVSAAGTRPELASYYGGL
jgi:hypothetical protein